MSNSPRKKQPSMTLTCLYMGRTTTLAVTASELADYWTLVDMGKDIFGVPTHAQECHFYTFGGEVYAVGGNWSWGGRGARSRASGDERYKAIASRNTGVFGVQLEREEAVKNKTIDCYKCGAKMHRTTKLETVEYQGLVSPEFESPLYRCDNCAEEIVTGVQMQVTVAQMTALKARSQAAVAVSLYRSEL